MLRGMNSDARLSALRYYARCGRVAVPEVCALLANPKGVFVFTPELVVMMKPADSRSPQEWEDLESSPDEPDSWYVHLLVGRLRQARTLARLLPAYRWVCFMRGLRNTAPHRLPWARIRL